MSRFLLFVILISSLISCSNEIIYSGKILNQDLLENIDFKNKKNLTKRLGNPSYIDFVNNKYFYFSEKKQKKILLNDKIDYSYVFVFSFDQNNLIIKSQVFDLKDKKDFDFVKDKTQNEIIKRGLLEKVFGGVGTQQELPTTP